MCLLSSFHCHSKNSSIGLQAQIRLTALLVSLAYFSAGCSGISPTQSAVSPGVAPAIRMSISPTSGAVASGSKQQFAALAANTKNTGVIWSASQGTILNTGLFIAPVVVARTPVTVTAKSAAD